MKTVAKGPSEIMLGEVDGRKIIAPTGKALAHFYPKENFHSDEFGTDYMQGMKYTLREGNERLALALVKWQEEGKVVVMEVT